MNKKFLSAILFGALAIASTGSFVSCADNDSDIAALQDQNSELKAQLASLKTQLQAELKGAASEAAAAAVEAKLSTLDAATPENMAATLAALQGDFKTTEAKVIALQTQIKALEGLQNVDVNELLSVIEKAKENAGSADIAGISALVDALDADVNTLVSALRSLVFQPEFYVDGIEAAEYTYLRYVDLWEKGDAFALTTASSDEVSHDVWMAAPGGFYPTDYDRKNIKMAIKDGFKFQYFHTGDLADVQYEDTKINASSLVPTCKGEEDKTTCLHDGCTYPADDCGKAVAEKDGYHKFVGKNILNTVVFAKNPANAKVNTEDATLAIKNIMAMTRANEATIKVVDVDNAAQPGYAVVTYYVENPEKLITANHDEEYGVLNKVENTTIIKLQAGAAENTTVESDWAALYETSIQPVAIALNEKAKAGHATEKDSKWFAPIQCSGKANIYNELHKNPYEAADALARTAEIDYLSQGVNIADHIELHFVKRDAEKADHKHNPTAAEVQHPHVTMSLAEAAYKFGFEYEFNLVPYIIDDNKTNNSAYAHLVDGKVAGGKTAQGVEFPGLDLKDAVIIPNTVEEDPTLVKGTPWNLIPKKAVENSTYKSNDGYEQGASSVDREPLVQVLVKKDGKVILDGYVSFIITRTVGNVLAPVFDLGSQEKSCNYLHYSMTWNQVSELLYEKTANQGLGMSKLEFEESYELAMYDKWKEDPTTNPVTYPQVVKQFTNVQVDADGNVTADELPYEKTYANIFQEFDPNGIATTTLHLSLDKYDQQYVYEKKDRTDILYVMYVRKGSQTGDNHTTLHGILVPIKIALDEVKGLEYSVKNVNFWYDKTGAPNILDSIGINNQSIRFNVNYGKDNINTYEYENGTTDNETFKAEGASVASDVLGFVRDINDAWDGKALKFNKAGVYTKGEKPVYYFHPLTKKVEVKDEYSGTIYCLDVDNDNMFCDIWVDGDDPVVYEGVNKHEDEFCKAVSNEAPEYVKNAEKNHQVNTKKGIYLNNKLYAYVKGQPSTRVQIAEMNRYTGEVWYKWETTNDMSKKVLNATGHRVAEEYAYIGIFLPNACDDAYYINYDAVPENIFAAYWLRPLDIEPSDTDKVIDAVNNASYISIFDKYNFKDWRDYVIVDKKQNPMDYTNVWLLAFYGVNSMTLHLEDVKTDMNGHNFAKKLDEVNQDIKLSYVEHNKTTVIGTLGSAATKTIDLRASGYNKASKGVKSTYDYIVEHFGYLKYENKGANVSNFNFIVPVTFGYDWGEITTNFTVSVIGTEGNHDGE